MEAPNGTVRIFEVATEMSTDWPADGGISGLRELAARYRAEYLLLLNRHHNRLGVDLVLDRHQAK